MAWLDDQFLRLAKLDVPDDAAAGLIDTAYIGCPQNSEKIVR